MNSDPKKSAQPCGCDEGAKHVCEYHRALVGTSGVLAASDRDAIQKKLDTLDAAVEHASRSPRIVTPIRGLFPDSAAGRKAHPVFTGVLMYFPDAIAAVARVSKKGNDQHNPGEPLHWAREKSTDQTDTATRHMMDHGVGTPLDTDGEYHLAKAAWRILAELQLTIEKDKREGR